MPEPNRPWTEGDIVKFVTGKPLKVFAGLYFYSGFGYGDYYSTDGKVYWGSSSESAELAKRDGVKRDYIDSFTGYKPVYLGD